MWTRGSRHSIEDSSSWSAHQEGATNAKLTGGRSYCLLLTDTHRYTRRCINWSGNANAKQRRLRQRRQQHLGGDCEQNTSMRSSTVRGGVWLRVMAEVEYCSKLGGSDGGSCRNVVEWGVGAGSRHRNGKQPERAQCIWAPFCASIARRHETRGGRRLRAEAEDSGRSEIAHPEVDAAVAVLVGEREHRVHVGVAELLAEPRHRELQLLPVDEAVAVVIEHLHAHTHQQFSTHSHYQRRSFSSTAQTRNACLQSSQVSQYAYELRVRVRERPAATAVQYAWNGIIMTLGMTGCAPIGSARRWANRAYWIGIGRSSSACPLASTSSGAQLQAVAVAVLRVARRAPNYS